MKDVMELLKLDLFTAKEVIDNLPIGLKRGLSKSEAMMW
jgi:ribosomal protein L7/L12